MDAQRWVVIESLYHVALAKEPGVFSAYLAAACARDPTLRSEIESLLAYADAQLSSPDERSETAKILGEIAGIRPTGTRAAQLIDGPASLQAGQHLGPYEILAPIGAGGTGEVYKARDTRLKRDVAIKMCAAQFSARFEREARVIASLNHPNICQLYDVGPNFLVLELVEGKNLSGPLPVETALNYARQIAEALEAAHEKGIVHRDLKPANVRITPAGVVKVLDFGLAKAAEEPATAADRTNSRTQTISPTRTGMILGTAPYMGPEQARGAVVDKRADIWAFGCVLYEMLTGEQAFQGETTSDILAAVLKEEPDWSRISPDLQLLLRRCLVKDPKRRMRDIGEARIAIDASEEALTLASYMEPRRRLGELGAKAHEFISELPGGRPAQSAPDSSRQIRRLTLVEELAEYLDKKQKRCLERAVRRLENPRMSDARVHAHLDSVRGVLDRIRAAAGGFDSSPLPGLAERLCRMLASEATNARYKLILAAHMIPLILQSKESVTIEGTSELRKLWRRISFSPTD